MKNSIATLSLLLLIFATYWGFKLSMPSYSADENINQTSFSIERALNHVKNISQEPHAVGFSAHVDVRNYIIENLEKMGLETSLQTGYTAGDWANLSQATNIIARIKGSGNGKALLLLSHYDSHPHSSFGASDAGSGVATILEGVRAFLSKNKTPKNDIIVMFSDGEELGLNGASLFVEEHPWVKDLGLVLNFEARGSGGPSYMLIETNKGNGNLIKEFTKAKPDYPVANSLVYSIYKMLPNDTDLTVFREGADIQGFNFAFIDDHFDYHTAKDTYDRLDKKTLVHQGSYLMPLLNYFSDSNLNNIKSTRDYNYFNVPFFRLVSYPFDWIWPMFGLAVLMFILLIIYGFKKEVLKAKDIFIGFAPLLIALVINGVMGYFSFTILKTIYPQYQDILHGFTYNGYTYIAAFVLFSFAVCFYSYQKFKKISTVNLLVAPIIIWLLICGGLTAFLPGANFFIIPVYALLGSFLVLINQKNPNAFLLVFLALPAIWIFTPFIKMFPVGLGLKMMVASTALSTLVFFLLLPIFGFYKHKGRLALLSFILFIGFMIGAHIHSGYDENSAQPTSLLYVYNEDTKTANWATYDHVLSNWTKQYIGKNKNDATELNAQVISSKYNSGFTYTAPAPTKNIIAPEIKTTRDTIIGSERYLRLCVTPKRNVNRLDVFTNNVKITKAKVNTIPLSSEFLNSRKKGNHRLVTHYITNNAYTEIDLVFPKEEKLSLTIYEASNDLLTNEQFTVPARPKDNIPTPFVLNDAILVTKTISFE
ncbi:M28 family peptidase [Cellulophaga baltica]|uniref:M28 family peptidase n=1 Tax=Cellulophaga TaxID=104264 RepID=UPI001C06CD03|nr:MULTISPECIES: M28 family peptidase [Cellulophaga]MBU2997748.1 M28 family peptidase [Cellulophaga baltica]MDO6769144.1 M28 family peptidase [Cellulophaga sp. 1_MG-2023]